MAPVEPVGPFTVEIDIAITRRLKLHAVVDGNGEQIYHSRKICEIFAWLLEHAPGEITLVDDDHEFQIMLRPPLSPSPTPKG